MDTHEAIENAHVIAGLSQSLRAAADQTHDANTAARWYKEAAQGFTQARYLIGSLVEMEPRYAGQPWLTDYMKDAQQAIEDTEAKRAARVAEKAEEDRAAQAGRTQ